MGGGAALFGVLGAQRTREGRVQVTWHNGWGCGTLNERKRAGVGGRGPLLASWALNEREMVGVGDVTQQVGVLQRSTHA